MTKKTSPNSPRILNVSKDRDYACTYLNGKKIMLGRFGTQEAHDAFLRLQIQILTDPTLSSLKPQQVPVDSLCLAYLEYAREYDPSHFSSIKTAVEILLKHFTGQPVESLDSRSFLFLQEMFVQRGVSRKYCNTLMGHIRAMLKWGIVRKFASSKVYGEAKLIEPLKKGKTKARENPKRKDVSDDVINKTLPYLLPTLRDMVRVQRLSGCMRPSEVCRMKPEEIDTKYTTKDGVLIWMYTPGTHKNAWREKYENGEYVRIIPLGKPEQDILAPRMVGKSDTDYLFSPKDAMKEHYAQAAATRKTKVQPSQVKRKERNAKKPKRRDRDHYDRHSYNQAIRRVITDANKYLPEGEKIKRWTPYQIRHTAVTGIVNATGSVDIARAVAGQKTISVTQGYNHADVQIAIRQAVQRSR